MPTLRWLLWPMLFAVGPAFAQEGGGRIAYVDMQRLIDSAPQVVAAARAQLQAEFAERDRALDADAKRLAELDDRIRREADLMSTDDARNLRQEADALRSSIQRRVIGSARSSTPASTRSWTRPGRTSRPASPSTRAKPATTLVVGSPVIYASGRVDITDRVLDRLRQSSQEPR